jgi:hypothetical protein
LLYSVGQKSSLLGIGHDGLQGLRRKRTGVPKAVGESKN